MTSASPGVTIGVTGQRSRATVTQWGDIESWGPAATAWRWFVAADDRWHVPADEAAVRQRRVDGTPVVETRVRVPDGDAVQRVWSVADHGGLTVIEFENESSRPFAVAVTGGRLLTERPVADVPIQGIDLPGEAVVIPVGHRASVRVAIPHTAGLTSLPPGLPPLLAVVRGWMTLCDRASRLVLPARALVDDVVAARCDLVLEGPVGAGDDPLGFLLDVVHLARLGDEADQWLPEIVGPVNDVARDPDPAVDDALDGLERVATIAGDERAAADLQALRRRRAADGIGRSRLTAVRGLPSAATSRSRGAFVDGVERFMASGGELLPGGFPEAWLGSSFEVHGVPTSPGSTIGYAVRWHGDRPAILWEQVGGPLMLSAPTVDATWRTAAAQGEALWAPQHPSGDGVAGIEDDSVSFR